jgi:hypothetical protein
MNDADLGEALRALGMDEASWRALPLLPLVQVAWADGTVQEAERELILRLSQERWKLGAEAHRLLRNWLHHPPSIEYARRGHEALNALCDHAGSPIRREALADVLALALQVAKAAGGFFGFGAIGAEEALAIEEIARALEIAHDRRWVMPDEPTLVPADADEEADGPPPEIVFHADPETRRSRATLVQFDDLRGEQTCFVTVDGVTIGRSRENTVQINYDGQVSRKHCRIFERAGHFYVEDLDSTRGTWVNGERIIDRRLLGGETIHVGSGTFFFQLSPADVPSPGPTISPERC